MPIKTIDIQELHRARRFYFTIYYVKNDKEINITEDISKYIVSWSYHDYLTGAVDTLTLELVDKDRKWIGKWYPKPGAIIKMWVVVENWKKPGDNRKAYFGAFSIDSIKESYPPASVSIQAKSLPLTATASKQIKTRAWEKTSLKAIATDICKGNNIKLAYRGDEIKYDRIEQTNQTDLEFLYKLTTENQQCMHIADNTLYIYDEGELEKKPPMGTLTPDSKIASWNLSSNYAEVFKQAVVSTKSTKKKKGIKGIAVDNNVPEGIEKTLVIKKRASDAATAQRMARNALRNKNKKMYSAEIMLPIGNPDARAGNVYELKDFGIFSKKYLITEAVHTGNGSGYTTAIQMRGIVDDSVKK